MCVETPTIKPVSAANDTHIHGYMDSDGSQYDMTTPTRSRRRYSAAVDCSSAQSLGREMLTAPAWPHLGSESSAANLHRPQLGINIDKHDCVAFLLLARWSAVAA